MMRITRYADQNKWCHGWNKCSSHAVQLDGRPVRHPYRQNMAAVAIGRTVSLLVGRPFAALQSILTSAYGFAPPRATPGGLPKCARLPTVPPTRTRHPYLP